MAPQSLPPHEGHDSARAEVSGGAVRPPAVAGVQPQDLPFAEFTVQTAFHDLLSDDRAFAPNSGIDLLHLRMRYEPDVSRWRLERFGAADIISLWPLTLVTHQPSWKFSFGWQRNRDIGCDHCTPFFLTPAIGVRFQSHLRQRELDFLLLALAVAALVQKALSGIFGVALYRYATEGQTVGGFTREELESAVKTKGGRNAPPTATPGTN